MKAEKLSLSQFRDLLAHLETGKRAKENARDTKTTPAVEHPPKAMRRRYGGAIKNVILPVVRRAGPEGATIDTIAAKTGLTRERVIIWFNETGKWLAELKRIAPGTWVYVPRPKQRGG